MRGAGFRNPVARSKRVRSLARKRQLAEVTTPLTCTLSPLARERGFAETRAGYYGAGYTLGYLSSIPSSFITFSIASMSHGASFETTSAPLSVMKIMSSSRT